MSKAFLNRIESLQGREVLVDSIVTKPELEAKAGDALAESVQHSEGLYDDVFSVLKDGTGFTDRNAILYFGEDAGKPFVAVRPEGWVDGDSSTHGGVWSYMFSGRRIEAVGEVSFEIDPSDFDKGCYISLNAFGELVNTGAFPDFYNTALCMYAHWDSAGNTFIVEGDERHSAQRDTNWHYSKHREDGMVIRQLGQLSWVANDPSEVGLQLTTTQVADEDLEHLITHSVDGAAPFTQRLEGLITEVDIPTLIFDGAAIRKHTDTVPWSNAALVYNTNGTVVEVPDGHYVNYFLVATHCQALPIKLIMGRKIFDNPEESATETLEALGLNFPEIAMLYRITLEKKDSYGTVGNCSIYSAQQAASKNIFESQAGVAGAELPDHAALLGRGAPNQHPIEAITGAGTAATRDVGTSVGQVPEFVSNGEGLGGFGYGRVGTSVGRYADVNDVPKRTGFYLLTEGHPNLTNNKAPAAGFYDTAILRTLRQSTNDFVDVYLPYHQYSNGMVLAPHTSSGYATQRIVSDSVNLRASTGNSTVYPMHQKAVTDALNKKADKGAASTGSIALNGTTDNTVVMTDIVTELDLEIGDVIRIDTGAYNKLHTVESITDNSSIIVNYEHAGNRGDGSLKLPDVVGQATVTRIAKWFNAPLGMGQAIVSVARVLNTTYINSTNRSLTIIGKSSTGSDRAAGLIVDGIDIGRTSFNGQSGYSSYGTNVTAGATYQYTNNIAQFFEVR